MLAGVHERVDPKETKISFPGHHLTRQFMGNGGEEPIGSDLVRKLIETAQPSWDAGCLPMVSFKLNPFQVMLGDWDSQLEALGRYLLTAPTTWLIPWHEPEGTLGYGNFVGMFNRVYSVVKSASPTTQIGYSAMCYHWRPLSTYNQVTKDGIKWRPKNCDFYGADVYSGRSFALNAILPEHPGFRRWMDELVPSKAPVVVTERGFIADAASSTLRYNTILRERDWLMSLEGQRIQGYCYWNTSGTENDPLIVLDNWGRSALSTLVSDVSGRTKIIEGFNSWIGTL